MAWPLARDSRIALSRSAARRRASTRVRAASPGGVSTVTAAATTPMIASTTRSSISVKPPRRDAAQLQLPRADVGIEPFSPGRGVGAEAEYVDFAAQPGVEVEVRIAPRIARQPLQVPAGFPVRRCRRKLRARHQRGEPLLAGRIAQVVQPVQLQSLQQ